MTVPALPQTISDPTTGQAILTAWGDQVNSYLTYLGTTKPTVRATRGTTQTIANVTYTAVLLTAETWDYGGMHSTVSNTSRLTIPAGDGGKYLFGGSHEWSTNITGARYVNLFQNGAVTWGEDVYGSVGTQPKTMGAQLVHGTAADYFEFLVRQDSGAGLDLNKCAFYGIWMEL